MACAGDVPTLETLAAVDLLRRLLPELKVRVINVVDLMRLRAPSEHPHGLSDVDFDGLFTVDKPIVFAFHGYPWLIHRLDLPPHEPRQPPRPRLQGRGDHHHALRHDRLNDLDRFHLVMDVVERVPKLAPQAPHIKQAMQDRLIAHKAYVTSFGDDLPEVKDWAWRG